MKNSSGFSVVEVIVIIVTVSFLVAVGTVSYVVIQKQARDEQRLADINLLGNELEKYFEIHSEYPAGCPTSPCANTGNPALSWNTGTPINSFTTPAQLSTLFGSSSIADISDPSSTAQNPFAFRSPTNSHTYDYPPTNEYFYFGGLNIISAASGTYNLRPFAYHSNRQIRCNLSYTYNVSSGGHAILASVYGYYSESDNKIIIKTSRQGIKPTVVPDSSYYGTPTKCVLDQTEKLFNQF